MGLLTRRVFQQNRIHVTARILEETVACVEDDQRDLAVTQDAQLVRLFHETPLTFGECHLKHTQKLHYSTTNCPSNCSQCQTTR